MNLKVYTKNIQLDPRAEDHIQKKFKRLQRHLESISDAKLELSVTSARSRTDRVVAQMTLVVKGYTLRGQERGLNLYAAIDAVTDVMDRQIGQYKGKVYSREQARKAGKVNFARDLEQAAVDAEQEQVGDDVSGIPVVVRAKRFPMKPMSVEDAIMEMDLLSHKFFLFYNADAKEYNVVYRRLDGDYGIIQPELL